MKVKWESRVTVSAPDALQYIPIQQVFSSSQQLQYLFPERRTCWTFYGHFSWTFSRYPETSLCRKPQHINMYHLSGARAVNELYSVFKLFKLINTLMSLHYCQSSFSRPLIIFWPDFHNFVV